MTYTALPKPISYLIALAIICFSFGCEQQRYSPAKWTPATGSNGTLPGVGQLNSSGVENSSGLARTLPIRNINSLPWRAGGQSSLPNRSAMDTLPGRAQVVATQPNRKKKTKPPLPSLENKPVWDVTEKRQMPRAPGKPGLYMGQENPLAGLAGPAFGQRGSSSTLPSRGGSTLPLRRGSTLPFRGFNSSTLPGR